MRIISLLTLLPLLATSSPTPKAEAEAEAAPYNPFFPPGSKYANNHGNLDRRVAVSQANLVSRAALQQAGQVQYEELEQQKGRKRHEQAKRGPYRKIKREKKKRGKTCNVKPTTNSTSTAVSSTAHRSAVSVTTSFIGGGAIATPSSAVVTSSETTSSAIIAPSSAAVTKIQTTSSAMITSSSAAVTTIQTTSSAMITPSSVAVSSIQPSSSATPTTTSEAPEATRYTVDPAGNGPFSGWGTWFNDGLSACGTYDTPGMPIVAVSAQLFDSWPGYNGLNPNDNPICGLHLDITWGGKTVTAEVTDRCPGCALRSLDMSKGLFHEFAAYSVGLLGMESYTGNISWSWTSGTGRLPEVPY